ncbi:YIEGIA family protein [Gorillibacterium sp. sgz5001074]|uniref:YIEGIA family protein n=1 Tax=Gorillibacterium sp. sgz5001074 TaxID=3446695 RepID=UPI003F677FDD
MLDVFHISEYTQGILIGTVFGIVARLTMLRTDHRQYPTYPHGRIIHLALGVIAAALGSLAVPSLLEKEYTAVTFLTLAAQQFRDVRNMERQTLKNIDSMELVPRGATYIEGIAMVFEGRNYMVIFTAFTASLCTIVFAWYWGILAGAAALALSNRFKTGKSISAIADVDNAEIRMDGPDLYVGDIYIMNVGLEETRKQIAEHGLGLIVKPRNKNSRVTLANVGQRQAMLHDVSTIMGVFRDTGEPSLMPMAKLDMSDGRLAVLILPQEKDPEVARKVLLRVPLLESAVRMPSEAHVRSGEQL